MPSRILTLHEWDVEPNMHQAPIQTPSKSMPSNSRVSLIPVLVDTRARCPLPIKQRLISTPHPSLYRHRERAILTLRARGRVARAGGDSFRELLGSEVDVNEKVAEEEVGPVRPEHDHLAA